MTFPDWLKPLPGLMAIIATLPLYAEMVPLSEETLSALDGQSGLALSGSFDLNTAGGPLWDVERNPDGSVILDNGEAKCSVNDGRCGARFTLQATEEGGWFVLDNLKGGIEFGESVPGGQPLEIRVEERDNNAGETPIGYCHQNEQCSAIQRSEFYGGNGRWSGVNGEPDQHLFTAD